MREYQLRIYKIAPPSMADWVAGWRQEIVPLRAAHGFDVVGAWTNEADHEFVWIVAGGDGHGSFAERERAYQEARAGIAFNPGDFIESVTSIKMLDVIDLEQPV
jgi:hypothetical protein